MAELEPRQSHQCECHLTYWSDNVFDSSFYQPGDFSILDDAGQFVIKGNIYSHEAISQISGSYLSILGPPIDMFEATSKQLLSISAMV